MNDHNIFEEISRKHGDSFYVLNEENYIKNIEDLKYAFEKHYDKIIIGYSYKTNYTPKLCSIAKENGVYAEVVSEMELELALKLGYDYDKIIFNGPLKTQKDLERTLLNNSIVNLDSLYEVNILENIVNKYPNKKINVGLRVNMSLVDSQGNSSIQEGLAVGRFGFDSLSKEFRGVIEKIKALGVTINALHGHTSSSDRSLSNFKTIVQTLCRVRNEFDLDTIEYFNIGGGFYGPMPKGLLNKKTPTFEEYAQTIITNFNTDKWFRDHTPYIILEPGVSVVSNALSYVSRVIDIKKIRNKSFILIEGGIYNVKPTGHKINLPNQIIANKSKALDSNTEFYDVVGSTCMEKDIVLNNIEASIVRQNDYLKIDNVGAYTVVKTPNFINFIPAIISIKNKNNYQVIRERQKIDDLLINYKL